MKHYILESTLDFLKELHRNNKRDWFNENKALYIEAQQNFIKVVDDIIHGIANFDESVERLEAKSCVFRIYKDTRFSKDKTPYKTNMGASLREKGSKTLSHSGYYIHLEPGKSFLAGGVYMTETANLKLIRQKISTESQSFLNIINTKNFKEKLEMRGEKLVRIPQGFDKEDPMEDYLKFKQFTVFHELSDKEILDPHVVKNAVDVFKIIHPFNQFLADAINND